MSNIPAQTDWYALRVPATKELIARRMLELMGHRAHVPVERRECRASRYARRREEREMPAFPRYVFASFAKQPDWRALLTAPTIQDVVRRDGEPAAIKHRELEPFMEPIQQKNGTVTPSWVRVGKLVRVATGVFATYEAMVTFIDPKTSAVHVAVRILGKPLHMVLQLSDIGPLDTNSERSHNKHRPNRQQPHGAELRAKPATRPK